MNRCWTGPVETGNAITVDGLHIWTLDSQESQPTNVHAKPTLGRSPGRHNKKRNHRATAARTRPPTHPARDPVYPQYSYPYPAPPPKTNWWAVASFVLGLVGVIVLSVVFGLVALSQAKRGASGRGLAIAGLVLSGLCCCRSSRSSFTP